MTNFWQQIQDKQGECPGCGEVNYCHDCRGTGIGRGGPDSNCADCCGRGYHNTPPDCDCDHDTDDRESQYDTIDKYEEATGRVHILNKRRRMR